MPFSIKRISKVWKFSLSILAALGLTGCNRSSTAPQQPPPIASVPTATPQPPGFHFHNVTQEAGIAFHHNNGAFGAALLPETMGSGALWFDYDGDGIPDLFFVNGRDWTPAEIAAYHKSPINATEAKFINSNRANPSALPRQAKPKPARRSVCALYHNNGNGTFSDATRGSGLDVETMGMGASSADYDGDGKPDLCLTSYGHLFLFRNLGKGHFQDVSAQSGVQDSAWSTSAAWLDYDHNGRLDLFVCRYARWTPSNDNFVSIDKRTKSYGWPKDYPSQTCRLFSNVDGKHFEDVSAKAGISQNPTTHKPILGASLGVSVCDLNHDGWLDLVIANDLRPNFFFFNNRNGTFTEEGVRSGLSTGITGRPRGGMGIDTADVDHSGHDSIAVGNFNADIMGFWKGNGHGNFQDIAQQTEIGPTSATFLTFGLLFADFNNDSWPDLLAANGHIDPSVHNFLALVTYEERPLLFLNRTRLSPTSEVPQFSEVASEVGLDEALVARGLCVADYDLDGDLDVLMTTVSGAPRLLRNDGGNKNGALRIVLRGKAPNLDAVGAHIKARIGKDTVRRDVRTGSSYLSQSELPVTLGLGNAPKVDVLSIRWPDGTRTEIKDVAANQIITVSQSGGIVAHRPLAAMKAR
ncbi:hypothetical protein IAD21_03632 [Abditibacteriota bacterium]|nr:hypothetical protein IAD21_03632 [Abditibacteriota bacterium]